tara:strand:+ start:2236 stop:2349 length:114 start_codon:yes stop_codon:yes gene_type:complete
MTCTPYIVEDFITEEVYEEILEASKDGSLWGIQNRID